MEKKTIVARVRVLEGQEQAFMNAAEALVERTRAEVGNLSYNLYQNPFEPTSFIFYEEYMNEQAMSLHADSSHFRTFGKDIEGMLASELIIESF